jgi:hypothetical protein
MMTGSLLRCGTLTGTISWANFPESMAAIARWWLANEKASCSSRDT